MADVIIQVEQEMAPVTEGGKVLRPDVVFIVFVSRRAVGVRRPQVRDSQDNEHLAATSERV
mgnify:CR=1 FL=1